MQGVIDEAPLERQAQAGSSKPSSSPNGLSYRPDRGSFGAAGGVTGMTGSRVSRPVKSPEDAGRLGTERNRVKLTLGALQYFQAAGVLGVLVVHVLHAVAADLIRTGGQLRQSDGADRHLIGQLAGIDPPAQDHDVRVEHALPGSVIARTG
jgi:hypothetical protein